MTEETAKILELAKLKELNCFRRFYKLYMTTKEGKADYETNPDHVEIRFARKMIGSIEKQEFETIKKLELGSNIIPSQAEKIIEDYITDSLEFKSLVDSLKTNA